LGYTASTFFSALVAAPLLVVAKLAAEEIARPSREAVSTRDYL
jgi:hypothetical protein